MGRAIRNWSPDRVEDAAIAPDRTGLSYAASQLPYRKWQARRPYSPGHVIYIDRDGAPVLGRVVDVRRRHIGGEFVERYCVQIATRAGVWARQWVYVWPSAVRRGYALAKMERQMTTDIETITETVRARSAGRRRL